MGRDYLHLYIQVRDEIIQDIKYLCTCEPTANVVFEILCQLIKGKTLNDAASLAPEAFLQNLKATEPDFLKKASGVLELLRRGIARYRQSLSGASGSPLNPPNSISG
jgi:NifU-like protein involved in Fe-S cluster formation